MNIFPLVTRYTVYKHGMEWGMVVVGNYGYFNTAGDPISSLALFKNIGTNNQPSYDLITRDYAGISTINLNIGLNIHKKLLFCLKIIILKKLERKLTLPTIIAISIGGMLGSGIFVLPGIAAAKTGSSIWLAYLLASICILPAALSKSELS